VIEKEHIIYKFGDLTPKILFLFIKKNIVPIMTKIIVSLSNIRSKNFLFILWKLSSFWSLIFNKYSGVGILNILCPQLISSPAAKNKIIDEKESNSINHLL
jgi:hypothetical protein